MELRPGEARHGFDLELPMPEQAGPDGAAPERAGARPAAGAALEP